LAGFGISALQKREKEKRFNTALIIALSAIIAASLITFTIFHDSLRVFFKAIFSDMHHLQLHWEHTDVPEKALRMTDPGIYVPVITMSLYLASIVIFLKSGQKYIRNIALFLIFSIIFIEAQLFAQGTLPKADDIENTNRKFYTILAADKSGRMVFFSRYTLPLIVTTYGISLTEGYDQLKIVDYVNLVPTMHEINPARWGLFIENNSMLSMTNSKYLLFINNVVRNIEEVRWCVSSDDEGRKFLVPPVMCRQTNAVFEPVYRKLYSSPSASLYENMNVLPRAYPVNKIRAIDSIQKLMDALASFGMNPRYEAALSTKDVKEIGAENFSYGDVKIEEYKPDMVTISARFKSTGFIVLADQFYPGWKAYIDGKESKIYKTNAVQRGVIVPAGEHRVVFKYVPVYIYACMIYSGLLLALMLVALLKLRPEPHDPQG
ncbi:MAG TPA: YfhO family protein, partial [Dissulfurispiraceae bacterium]|nr:YfhO family protein [Dissulfurispiraceae bacterium]